MTVATFDPLAINVSPAALEHLRRQVEQSDRPHLRLGIKESGCNGYMYTLDFIDAPADSDHLVRVDEDLTICVSEDDLPLVQGTEIDYVTEGLNASLKFRNPRASTYCGCGESFAVSDAS